MSDRAAVATASAAALAAASAAASALAALAQHAAARTPRSARHLRPLAVHARRSLLAALATVRGVTRLSLRRRRLFALPPPPPPVPSDNASLASASAAETERSRLVDPSLHDSASDNNAAGDDRPYDSGNAISDNYPSSNVDNAVDDINPSIDDNYPSSNSENAGNENFSSNNLDSNDQRLSHNSSNNQRREASQIQRQVQAQIDGNERAPRAVRALRDFLSSPPDSEFASSVVLGDKRRQRCAPECPGSVAPDAAGAAKRRRRSFYSPETLAVLGALESDDDEVNGSTFEDESSSESLPE